MSTIEFRAVKKIDGTPDPSAIEYTDENGGVWFVPEGHRIWTEIYLPWLAAGNTPASA